MKRRASGRLYLLAGVLIGVAFGIRPAHAQTAADVRASVSKACAVMSGNQKPDGQFLQIMMLVDGDMSDANPIGMMLQRGVLQQCPKSYLGFKQRERSTNPFAAHPLLSGGSTSLLGPSTSLLAPSKPPQDYAFFCRGGRPMASHAGGTLIVRFRDPGHPASSGLGPGQCAWWSRNLRPGEPDVIEAFLGKTSPAINGVRQLNAGGSWTFWVYNVDGKYFNTTRIAKGYVQSKPQ